MNPQALDANGFVAALIIALIGALVLAQVVVLMLAVIVILIAQIRQSPGATCLFADLCGFAPLRETFCFRAAELQRKGHFRSASKQFRE
ncbi:MAG TPA: hypothetical protein VMT20_03430 [Terriglobia bacterium]|nr:hypothetical protein [Terriglobia bacterium]